MEVMEFLDLLSKNNQISNSRVILTKYNWLVINDDDISFDEEFMKCLLVKSNYSIQINNNKIIKNLPNETKRLIIDGISNCNHNFTTILPPALKELYIYDHGITKFDFTIDCAILPMTLEVLYIQSGNFNQNISLLPYSLKRLYICSHIFNQSIEFLPPSLEFLELLIYHTPVQVYNHNHALYNLPVNIKKVIICDDDKYLKNTDLEILKTKYPNTKFGTRDIWRNITYI